MTTDWHLHLLTTPLQISTLLQRARRIAVVGIKPETHAEQPAFEVPQYLQNHGFEVIPVPVYYPEITQILGQPVYRRLVDIPGEIDIVNLFRRAVDVPKHVDDILAKRPKAVWMQLGIAHAEVAETLARAGIDVVQDLCIKVEHRNRV